MAKYKLEEHLYVVGEGKDRKVVNEAGLKGIKDGRARIVLLGGPGQEIPLEQAEELGIVKKAKESK